MSRIKSFSGHYIITENITNKNTKKVLPEYDSSNTERLNSKDLEKLILSLPEIKKIIYK